MDIMVNGHIVNSRNEGEFDNVTYYPFTIFHLFKAFSGIDVRVSFAIGCVGSFGGDDVCESARGLCKGEIY